MAVLTHLETDTGTNVDISAATAVGAYTANADKLIMVDVSIDAVAGNGDYVMYVTRQIGGSGSAYRILPQTTMTAASGLTAISGQSGWITVRNGDVLTVYIDGLAGDTSTPDWSTRWFELAGVTAAGVADAVWDEAIADHTTATTFGGKNQKVVPSETINDYKADVSAITGAALSASGIDAILDEIVVGTYTMRQILKLMAAKMHGKATGGGTTSIKYTGLDNVADVIIETVDTNGNRSAVSLTV